MQLAAVKRDAAAINQTCAQYEQARTAYNAAVAQQITEDADPKRATTPLTTNVSRQLRQSPTGYTARVRLAPYKNNHVTEQLRNLQNALIEGQITGDEYDRQLAALKAE